MIYSSKGEILVKKEDLKFEDIKNLIKKAESICDAFAETTDERKEEIDNIRTCTNNLFEQRFKEDLLETPIDVLSAEKDGVRIGYLRVADINNIYQLSQLNYSQIRSIEGIGPKTAKRINELKHKVVDTIKRSVSLRIDTQNPSDAEKSLLKAVCVFLCHDEIRSELKPYRLTAQKNLQPSLDVLKSIQTGIEWFFLSKNKKAVVAAASEQIEEYTKTNQKTIDELFQNYKDICSADDDLYIQHFNMHSVLYYATIEKYCKKITAASKVKNEANAEFIKEIKSESPSLNKFKGTLRPYQLFGVKYILHQKRVLLGDEMGLGKTVQAIAAMIALNATNKNRFLVVCPASVLINWIREIKTFSSLNVIKIQGENIEALNEWIRNGGVAVTTYDSLVRLPIPSFLNIDMLIADEAHFIKNPDAQRTQSVIKLLNRSEYVLYMTGTPLVNRVEEMCFLVRCIQPELGEKLDMVKMVSSAEQFRYQLAPVYLRRDAEEILKELPPLVQKDQWCELNNKELEAYRASLRTGNYMAIRQVSWNTNDIRDSSKANRLIEICCTAKDQNRKVIVFSYFLDTLRKAVESLKNNHEVFFISGQVSSDKRQKIADDFKAAPAGAVLITQITAGGVGLNIQSANVVVFCEPQLTHAAEEQAIKRAHRMGQTRDVISYRLIADDTVDERILEILSEKKKNFEQFAEDSVVAVIEKSAQAEKSLIAEAVKIECERWQIQ